jgi:hypothetical protein
MIGLLVFILIVVVLVDSNDYDLTPGYHIEIESVVDDDGNESIDVSIQGTLKEEGS